MKIILRNTNLVFQSENFNVDTFIDVQLEIESPEFKSAILDAEEKILWGRYQDNTTTDIDLTEYTIDGVSVTKIVNKIVEKYNL